MNNNNNNNKRKQRSTKNKRTTRIPRSIRTPLVKYVDSNFGSTSLLNTGNIGLLTMPLYGTTANQRLGDIIHVRKIEISLQYKNEGASPNVLRFGIFCYAGYFPTPTLNTVLAVPSDPKSFYIGNYNAFVRKIWDKQITSCPNSETDLVTFRMTKTCNKQVTFTPGLTQTVENTFTFFALSDSAVIPSPSYDIFIRLWFCDN